MSRQGNNPMENNYNYIACVSTGTTEHGRWRSTRTFRSAVDAIDFGNRELLLTNGLEADGFAVVKVEFEDYSILMESAPGHLTLIRDKHGIFKYVSDCN